MLSYRFIKSMDVTENAEINKSATGDHVLLATQGSKFKDSVMDQVKKTWKAKRACFDYRYNKIRQSKSR